MEIVTFPRTPSSPREDFAAVALPLIAAIVLCFDDRKEPFFFFPSNTREIFSFRPARGISRAPSQ